MTQGAVRLCGISWYSMAPGFDRLCGISWNTLAQMTDHNVVYYGVLKSTGLTQLCGILWHRGLTCLCGILWYTMAYYVVYIL